VVDELFHAVRHKDTQTDMTKIIAYYCNFTIGRKYICYQNYSVSIRIVWSVNVCFGVPNSILYTLTELLKLCRMRMSSIKRFPLAVL